MRQEIWPQHASSCRKFKRSATRVPGDATRLSTSTPVRAELKKNAESDFISAVWLREFGQIHTRVRDYQAQRPFSQGKDKIQSRVKRCCSSVKISSLASRFVRPADASALCGIDLPSPRSLSRISSATVLRWIDLPSPRSMSQNRKARVLFLNRSAFDKSPGSSASVENTVQRNRKDALPLPPLRKRCSEQVAFEIARSSHSVDEALSYYRRLTHTPGSLP